MRTELQDLINTVLERNGGEVKEAGLGSAASKVVSGAKKVVSGANPMKNFRAAKAADEAASAAKKSGHRWADKATDAIGNKRVHDSNMRAARTDWRQGGKHRAEAASQRAKGKAKTLAYGAAGAGALGMATRGSGKEEGKKTASFDPDMPTEKLAFVLDTVAEEIHTLEQEKLSALRVDVAAEDLYLRKIAMANKVAMDAAGTQMPNNMGDAGKMPVNEGKTSIPNDDGKARVMRMLDGLKPARPGDSATQMPNDDVQKGKFASLQDRLSTVLEESPVSPSDTTEENDILFPLSQIIAGDAE